MAGKINALCTLCSIVLLAGCTEARSRSPLFGTSQNTYFNDGASFRALSAIRLYHGWVIDGIQGRYLNATDNSLKWMPFHGTKTQFTEINVAYPQERFVATKGSYGPYSMRGGQITLTELSIMTYNSFSKKTTTYGPFGGHDSANQTHFQTANNSELVGLYGYSSDYDYIRGLGFILDRYPH